MYRRHTRGPILEARSQDFILGAQIEAPKAPRGWRMGREYLQPTRGSGRALWAPRGVEAEPRPPTYFWHIWGPQNTSAIDNSVTLLNDVQSPQSDMFIWNKNDALKLQILVLYVPTKPVFFVKKSTPSTIRGVALAPLSGYSPVIDKMQIKQGTANCRFSQLWRHLIGI